MAASPQQRETVKGLAVGALLLVAMVGLFFYERGQFDDYEVAFEESEAGQPRAETGTLSEGQSAGFTFPVESGNVARVRAALTWTDAVAPSDVFRVTVTGPDSTLTESHEGTTSPLDVMVPVTASPNATRVPARSADEATQRAEREHADSTGMGNWTVTVHLVSAPGTAAPGNLPAGGTPDGTNDFTLTFAYDVYAARGT